MSLPEHARDELWDALDAQHDDVWHVHAAECCWPFTGAADALLPVVERLVADARADALEDAARYFEYAMAPAWGGDAHWLSTGNRVADRVSEVLRDGAARIRGGR